MVGWLVRSFGSLKHLAMRRILVKPVKNDHLAKVGYEIHNTSIIIVVQCSTLEAMNYCAVVIIWCLPACPLQCGFIFAKGSQK
jgi:hypothetical protein